MVSIHLFTRHVLKMFCMQLLKDFQCTANRDRGRVAQRERERERYRDTLQSEGDIANADPTQLLAVSQYPHVLCPGIDSLHHSPFSIRLGRTWMSTKPLSPVYPGRAVLHAYGHPWDILPLIFIDVSVCVCVYVRVIVCALSFSYATLISDYART